MHRGCEKGINRGSEQGVHRGYKGRMHRGYKRGMHRLREKRCPRLLRQGHVASLAYIAITSPLHTHAINLFLRGAREEIASRRTSHGEDYNRSADAKRMRRTSDRAAACGCVRAKTAALCICYLIL
jgi:hypothetical protein